MKLDPFYLIVDRASWLPRLLPQGVKLVQLRAKGLDEPELRREIATAREVCARYGAQLIVNDYWRLAIEEGCDFVHLGQEDLADADIEAIRRAGVRLGISTHDEAELEVALLARPDYVALGPVYPTILKKMRWEPQGLERVAAWKKRLGKLPLVGIGGLTIERAPGVLRAGADSLAVVTDVLLNDSPEKRAREWVLATRETV
ncbi:thiamine phosphate synthase [Starkeya koreensis]|uniref:Thiamine-phosphate synthase n=1 Tax=Ancylobacter koreensis TaxID=266121 RepID=A0ABT0DQW6_9HYPH|nr:thiamine phosphate synthase [Ancylobacter koreensis]MCK0209673.1 thiamine phosphate synthase [Ancylobacter koreensis]